VELDIWMDRGFSVLLNGSRQHFSATRQKYAERLLPVCLTVCADTLEKRLITWGRENAGEIEAWLFRAQAWQECLPPGCRTRDNEGDIQKSARRFLRLIEEHETCLRAHSQPSRRRFFSFFPCLRKSDIKRLDFLCHAVQNKVVRVQYISWRRKK
jgi:ribose 1,5-bisphosphokinase